MAMTDEEITAATAASLAAREAWASGDESLGGDEGAALQALAIVAKREGLSDPIGALLDAARSRMTRSFDSLGHPGD